MAIKSKKARAGKIEIDISGPQGNAFVLLSYAKQYAKQLDKDGEDISKRMKSGDYENLLSVFDEEFGDYIDLIR